MSIKKILLISLITVAIIASVSAVSAGLLDGWGETEQQDNVIEIDNIAFNTTNITKFKEYNKDKGEGYNFNSYVDENDTGYTISIINCSEVNITVFNVVFSNYKADRFDNLPSETINGIVVYTTSADSGDNVGQPRYLSYIQNRDLRTIVEISTPNPNETAKIASTLKFK